MTPSTNTRLYFLDWVRIIAFFILIFYHVGMYYVTWGWHVKSPYAGDTMEPFMMLSSPWRLGLLFLVSGVASSFMLAKVSVRSFVGQRSWRLLVPLIFGMVVIVPVQPYFEVVEKLQYQGSFLDFMRLYLHAYHGFCTKDGCLDLPTWNHLWFVAYLWVYTLVLAAWQLVAGKRAAALGERVAGLLHGWKLVVLPVAVLWALRVLLYPYFPQTHALVDDWYNHALYFGLFAMGALLGKHPRVWGAMDALRWHALGLALLCWSVMMVLFSLPDAVWTAPGGAALLMGARGLYAIAQWCPVIAACGFAHRHLNVDGPSRRYLAQAVFPVYILHQSLIVAMAHLAKPAHVPPATEAILLIVATFTLSFGLQHLIRKVRVLRPLFGLGAEPASAPAARPASMDAMPAR